MFVNPIWRGVSHIFASFSTMRWLDKKRLDLTFPGMLPHVRSLMKDASNQIPALGINELISRAFICFHPLNNRWLFI